MSKKAKKAQKKVAKTKDEQDSSKLWGAFSVVSALLAASVARKGLNATWKAATGKEPPANPADPTVAMREAILWAVLSGTVVAVVRMLATRRAAGYYAKSTGKLPPGVRSDA